MKRTRKRLALKVVVSVPMDMPAAQVRKEVKSLISFGAGWQTFAGEEVKAISVKPGLPRDRKQAWRGVA